MSERGGPTTQSGILYQNSIAALYLGRLCDATRFPNSKRVIEVRVEAPMEVDDIIVVFKDNHRIYAQAKENVRINYKAWKKLWSDFDSQFQREDFQKGHDRLLLWLGEIHNEHQNLKVLCERAAGSKTHSEWLDRLTDPQQKLLNRIKPLLSPILQNETQLLAFFKHIDVEIYPITQIEQALAPYWMPKCDKDPMTLFRLLRDRVGGEARIRGSFASDKLRSSLKDENNVNFATPLDIDVLRRSVKECGALLLQYKYTFANTNIHLPRKVVNDIVSWTQGASDEENTAMLLDQAGMGKTVVARDILCALNEIGTTVLAIKADKQLSGITKYEDLHTNLHFPEPVDRVVWNLSEFGPVVVLIDQVDALSLSMARDQSALNIVIELIAKLRLISDVRIIISCRIFDLNNDPRLNSIEVKKQFSLQELSDDEVKSVLNEIGFDFEKLLPSTKKLLRVPLHLDLFVRAMESGKTQTTNQAGGQDITSLQELYVLLWKKVVLKPEPKSPLLSERDKVLQVLTDYMDLEQRTSAPMSLFTKPETEYLRGAVNWLASAGILIPGRTEWSYFHQTFFDYCYAKYFVESGGNLHQEILNSDQGLSLRPKLINVLAYLRGSNTKKYLSELQNLFQAQKLRFHLRELLIQWFGSLLNPTDEEEIILRRIFIDPETRPRMLFAIRNNPDWFDRVKCKLIKELLVLDDQIINMEIVPYLISMLDIAESEVIDLIKPYFGQNQEWNKRIGIILTKIYDWRSTNSIELLEQIIREIPEFDLNGIHWSEDMAKTYPQISCRLIRLIFDRIFEKYLQKREEAGPIAFVSLPSELDSLKNSDFYKTIQSTSQNSPKLFIETMLPWLERVVRLSEESSQEAPFYSYDAFSHDWHNDPYVIKNVLIQSTINSLSSLALKESEDFRRIARQFAMLTYKTPQLILANVYRKIPQEYADDALQFLLEDQRRLNLGATQQYDSRQLIKAIYSFLSKEKRNNLESFILSFIPVCKNWGVEGLKRRRLEQLYLLQSIPVEYLTPHGSNYLRELERKFPGIKASEEPISLEGGVVRAPIPDEAFRKMSDKDWLSAMRKYQGDFEHSNFLKGGARELSHVLESLIKENPERFYQLFKKVPNTVDYYYLEAFLNGLAESNGPADWLFDAIRNFSDRQEHEIRRYIAWALQKRARNGLPDDMMALLENEVRSVHPEDPTSEEMEGDLDGSYINSRRGFALNALMRALDSRGSAEAENKKWELIEFVATEPSTVLRVGGIEELIYLLNTDMVRALDLFEKLMNNHQALLCSRYTQDFLYYSIGKSFSRIEPYIRAMMNEGKDECKRRGAELACIAAISPRSMDSDADRESAKKLASEVITGPVQWKRGAVRIYTDNISAEPSAICAQELIKLFNDDEVEVRQSIGEAFNFLRGDQMFELRDFIEAYATSRSLYTGIDKLAKYLWEHGLLDLQWSLSIVDTILNNEYRADASLWISGGEELIRLVLRIYTDPSSDDKMRANAMDLFDRLMERYAGEAQKVLKEWDRR